MTIESDLKPGDIFVTPTYGAWYDRFVGAAIRWVTGTRNKKGKWVNARVNHTGIYVGNGQIIEARPNGAVLSNWDAYGSDAIWSINGLGARQADGTLEPLNLTDEQRSLIVANAKSLLGTPYGFLDILAVGLAQARLHGPIDVRKAIAKQPWWVRKIMGMHTLICSQLDDTAFKLSGIKLYADERLPGLVTPENILELFL